jgi:hypothetical protein
MRKWKSSKIKYFALGGVKRAWRYDTIINMTKFTPKWLYDFVRFQKVGMFYLFKFTKKISQIGQCQLKMDWIVYVVLIPIMVWLVLVTPWVMWLATCVLDFSYKKCYLCTYVSSVSV